jgi:hypothetical protein
MATLLEEGLDRRERTTTGIERAFLGERGPIRSVPSPRVRTGLALFAVAARHGQPVGPAMHALADHLDELRRVERDARANLDRVVGTLRSTGAVFGPLVGGATVGLAAFMSAADGVGGGPIDLAGLGPAVGVYVLALSVTLTALSVGLHRGLDRQLLAQRVGTSLLTATACFLGAYVVTVAVT